MSLSTQNEFIFVSLQLTILNLLVKTWGFNHDPQNRTLKVNLPPTGKGNKDFE